MRSLGILILLLARALPASAGDPAAARFTASQLRADLVEISRALQEMPADLGHSVDETELAQALHRLDSRLADSAPLTRDQAWAVFATLNPLLADGHLFVGFADWRGDTRAHLEGGGRLFPLNVSVTQDCVLRDTSHGNARIISIDGRSAAELCAKMLALVHGDSPSFRADLLSRRFWLYHWKLFGTSTTYAVRFEHGGTREFAGESRLPDLLVAEDSFDRQFRLALPGHRDGAAVLTLGTFAWPDKQQLLVFTRQAFETLRRERVKTLVIDLRDNGGGNDDQWIEGVMPFIATRPFRTASTFRKRVVTPDPAKQEVAGAVVDGEIQTWFPPQPDNAAAFAGEVFVAVGPGTYSSAVVMSTVVQDFGFGKLVGPGGSVRAGQSGGTRQRTLMNTGLALFAPRFVLTRPSGAKTPEYLSPDLPALPELRAPPTD